MLRLSLCRTYWPVMTSSTLTWYQVRQGSMLQDAYIHCKVMVRVASSSLEIAASTEVQTDRWSSWKVAWVLAERSMTKENFMLYQAWVMCHNTVPVSKPEAACTCLCVCGAADIRNESCHAGYIATSGSSKVGVQTPTHSRSPCEAKARFHRSKCRQLVATAS